MTTLNPLDASDYFDIANRLIESSMAYLENGKYDDALAALARARKYARNDSVMLYSINEREKTIFETRSAFIKSLEDDLTNVFRQDTFDSAKARHLLDVLQKEDKGNEIAAVLRADLPEKEAAEQERREVESFRRDLEKIWAKAQQYEEEGAGTNAIDEYEKALFEAKKMLGNFPDSPRWIGIHIEATKRRDKAVEIWEGTRTLIIEERGKELIGRYEALKVAEQAEAEFFTEDGQFEGRYPIEQCISKAREMANKFADKKAHEYLNVAKQMLVDSPVAAETKIKEALSLAYLGDYTKEGLEQELRDYVRPAIERRGSANKKIKQASRLSDPEQAWETLADAEGIDANAPGLSLAREKLVPRLLQKFDDFTSKAQLEQELENFEEAAKLIDELINMATRYQNFGAEFEHLPTRARERQEDLKVYRKRLDELDRKLIDILSLADSKPELAEEQVNQLTDPELGPNEKARIERCVTKVKFRLGVEQLYNSLEEKMFSAKNEVELIPLDELTKKAIEDYPSEDKFKKLLNRLRLRGAFLKGVRLKEDPKRRIDAAKLLEDVLVQKGDDAAIAQDVLDEIRVSEAQEADIEIKIKQANEALKHGEPRLAYMYLEPYKSAVSRKATEIKNVISVAQLQWQQKITQELEHVIRNPDFTPLDVHPLIIQLEQSQSPELADWKERALAPALAVAAKDWQELGRIENALETWEEAFRLAPTNKMILEGRKNALKRKGLINAQLSPNSEIKEELLGNLNVTYSGDIEVKRYLAEFYYGLHKYPEARLLVRQAQFLSKAQPDIENHDSYSAIETLSGLLDETDAIEARKLSIRTKLAGVFSVESVWDAKTAFYSLVSEFNHRKEELETWWEDLVQQIVQKLRELSLETSTHSGTAWRRVELLIKILILAPSEIDKQEVTSLLALSYKQFPDQIALVVNNYTGKNFGTRSEALQHHLDKSNEIYTDLKNLSQFENISSSLKIELPENRVDIGYNLLALNETIHQLRSVINKKAEIKAHVLAAMATGEWEHIEDSWEEIVSLKFGNHRGVQDIKSEIDKAKYKRREAERVVGDINGCFAEDEFDRLLVNIDKLQKVDPEGIMMLSDLIQLQDPFTHERILGVENLRAAVENKLNYINRIKAWRSDQYPSVELTKVQEEIDQYVEKGNFNKAIEIAETVINENCETSVYFDKGFWTWGYKLKVLKGISVIAEGVNSRPAEVMVQDITKNLQVLEDNIKVVSARISQVRNDQKRFVEILKELKPLWERIKARTFLDQWMHNDQLRFMREQALALISEGQNICHDYALFKDYLKDPFMKK